MRILLADDHDLVRDAIGSMLMAEDDNIEVLYAKDLSEALELLRTDQSFEIIILDLRMPGMNGLAHAQTILKIANDIPVMIMSGQAQKGDIRTAYKVGIKGFVAKTLSGKSLINAIRLVAFGETFFPIDILSDSGVHSSDEILLTDREGEVLAQLLRQGSSNKEIANALSIAETTVKLHIRSLSDKLQARNRTDIVIKAIDAGLS